MSVINPWRRRQLRIAYTMMGLAVLLLVLSAAFLITHIEVIFYALVVVLVVQIIGWVFVPKIRNINAEKAEAWDREHPEAYLT